MISIDYILEEAGWATAKIGNGETIIDITVSYLHDTLKQLAESAIFIDTEKAKRIIFMDEPGEHHLIIFKESEEMIKFEIRWYEDWTDWNAFEDEKSTIVLTGKTMKTNYVNEVRSVLIKLINKFGPKTYKEKWIQHDFPLNELEKLK